MEDALGAEEVGGMDELRRPAAEDEEEEGAEDDPPGQSGAEDESSEPGTAQLAQEIMSRFSFAHVAPKRALKQPAPKKKTGNKARASPVSSSGSSTSASSVATVARQGIALTATTTTALSSAAAASTRNKRKSTEQEQALEDPEAEVDGSVAVADATLRSPTKKAKGMIIKEEMEDAQEDEGLLWDEVEFDEDNATDAAENISALHPSSTANGASVRDQQPGTSAIKAETLSTDIQNLILQGNKKRKRKEQKEKDKVKTSRQQEAEKRKRKGQRERALEVHQVHLLCLLTHHYHTNKYLEDEMLKSLLLSMVPSDLLIMRSNAGYEPDFKNRLRELMKWFRETFEIGSAATDDEFDPQPTKNNVYWRGQSEASRFSLLPDKLAQVAEQRRGSPAQIAQLFISLCRALSLSSRYVAVLDPITFKLPTTPRKSPAKSQSLLAKGKPQPLRLEESQEKRGKGRRSSRTKDKAAESEEAEVSLMPGYAYDPDQNEDVEEPSRRATTSTQSASLSAAEKKSPGRRKNVLKATLSPPVSPHPTSGSTCPTKEKMGSIPKDMPQVWTEIYYPRETRFIHVDIVRNAVDQPQYYEETYASLSLSYVVSLSEHSLSVRDVTRRYAARWSEAMQRRMPEPDWWHQTLSVISRPTEEMMDQNSFDESEQKGRELTEQMPTTLAAFKTHPLYCLERFVHKYEALYPRGPILGEFKGEPIFPRSCIRKLHTKDKWIQKARSVREGEVPIKQVRRIIKKRSKKNLKEEDSQAEEVASQSLFNDDEDGLRLNEKNKEKEKDDDEFVDLFGKWQTEEFKPPLVVDGIVPKNEFGNVYLFKPSMLPIGAAHVKHTNALSIARRINVDAAPAMVGWRWAGARSVPEIEGIVVAEEYAGLIEELCEEELHRKLQAELEKKRKMVVERWKRMAKKLLIKQHINRSYETQHEKQSTEDAGTDNESKAQSDLTITLDKIQMENRRGKELRHTHTFGEERCVDAEEDLWEKTCTQCGFVLSFEKM